MTEGIDDPPRPTLLPRPNASRSAPVDLLRRPLELLWPLHQRSQPLAGQIHLSVPLAGGPPRADAAARISRHLQGLWVSNPIATSIRVTSVAVTLVADPAPDAPAPHRLILMLTYQDGPGDQKLDSAHMARHLESALQTLA